MRSGVATLPTARPLGERMPGVYVEDLFTQRFTAALDEVLAPIFATLDCFASYLDPRLAPEDFLDWLASWVALDVEEGRPSAQRRDLVAKAVELHRWRGTRRGLAEHVRLLTGGEVEVTDSGGCTSSDRPGQPLPDAGPAGVVVRVRVPNAAALDVERLTSAVVGAVPAHVNVRVEVVEP